MAAALGARHGRHLVRPWRASRPPLSSRGSATSDAAPEGIADAALRLARHPASEESAARAWEAFEERALQGCGALRGEEITRTLYACTVARRRPQRLLERLAAEIPDKFPQFNASGLCICLHAYAQMRRRDGKLFSVVTRRLTHPSRSKELTPAHIASLLYSHVRALLSDGGLISLAQERARAQAERFSVEDLATMLQAFATLQARDASTASACASAAGAHVSKAPLAALSDILGAVARLGAPSGALRAGVARRCEDGPGELADLSAAELSRLLLGLAEEGERAPRRRSAEDVAVRAAREGVARALAGRLDELDGPRTLVQATEALASARLANRSVADDLGRRIAQMAVDLSIKDVAAVATACQRLLVKDNAALEALARQGLRKGWRFRPRYAEAVLSACAAAGFEHSAVEELRSALEEARRAEAEKRAEAEEGGRRTPENATAESDEAVLMDEEAPLFGTGAAALRGPGLEGGHPMEGFGATPLREAPARLAKPLGPVGEDPRLQRLLRQPGQRPDSEAQARPAGRWRR